MSAPPLGAEVRPVPSRAAGLLFVLVWLTYGAAIKSDELRAYNLQQAGIDALVEHGTLELGKSDNPRLKIRGDVFRFEGRLYPAKQPGQFVLGAAAYTVLRWLGLSYDRDYVTTAAWITWLSSSSFAALLPTLLLVLLARPWGLGRGPSLAAALVLAFGTPLLAYSGVAHQDVIGSSLLLLAFVFLEEARRSDRSGIWFAFGAACGLVLFASMLPALMVMALLAASLLSGSVRRLGLVGAGFALGMLPLALMNWMSFGSPVVQSYMAGGYTTGLFRPSWEQISVNGREYLGLGGISVWLYAPVVGAGLLLLPLAFWRDSWCRRSVGIILVAVALHLTYVLNIHTIGGCQFGPRYLMPCLAFAMTGCALQWSRGFGPGSSGIDRALGVLLGVVALASIVVAVAGARTGTMICDRSTWAAAPGLSGWPHLSRFPLAIPMATGLSVVLGGVLLRRVYQASDRIRRRAR
jgi:hypothetical protein